MIAEQVEADLRGLGIAARRFAGSTRMGTAVELALSLWGYDTPPEPGPFILVNLGRIAAAQGSAIEGWAPALAAAPLSGQLGAPQLGVYQDSYPRATEEYLREVATGGNTPPAVVLLGGIQIISRDVLEAVRASVEDG